MNKQNLLKICLQLTYPTDFCIICNQFYYGKKYKLFNFLKNNDYNKIFTAQVVTTNGFALNHDKSLQIYFLCVQLQAKNNFLKDVNSPVMQEYRVIALILLNIILSLDIKGT